MARNYDTPKNKEPEMLFIYIINTVNQNVYFLPDNLNPNFLLADESAKNEGGDPQLEVVQDVDTDFYVILAVFFPSVTGIFTGCNLSGKFIQIRVSSSTYLLIIWVQETWKILKSRCR